MPIKPQIYQLISHLLSLLMLWKWGKKSTSYSSTHIIFKWLLNCEITRLYVRYCVKMCVRFFLDCSLGGSFFFIICNSFQPKPFEPIARYCIHMRFIFVFNFYSRQFCFLFCCSRPCQCIFERLGSERAREGDRGEKCKHQNVNA